MFLSEKISLTNDNKRLPTNPAKRKWRSFILDGSSKFPSSFFSCLKSWSSSFWFFSFFLSLLILIWKKLGRLFFGWGFLFFSACFLLSFFFSPLSCSFFNSFCVVSSLFSGFASCSCFFGVTFSSRIIFCSFLVSTLFSSFLFRRNFSNPFSL